MLPVDLLIQNKFKDTQIHCIKQNRTVRVWFVLLIQVKVNGGDTDLDLPRKGRRVTDGSDHHEDTGNG